MVVPIVALKNSIFVTGVGKLYAIMIKKLCHAQTVVLRAAYKQQKM